MGTLQIKNILGRTFKNLLASEICKNYKFMVILATSAILVCGCVTKENTYKGRWDLAQKDNSIEAYKSFIEKYPNSKLASDAKHRVKELQHLQDGALFHKMVANKTSDAYSSFIEQYPEEKDRTLVYEFLSDTELAPLMNSLENIVITLKIGVPEDPDNRSIFDEETVQADILRNSIISTLEELSLRYSRLGGKRINVLDGDGKNTSDNSSSKIKNTFSIDAELFGQNNRQTFRKSNGESIWVYFRANVWGHISTKFLDLKLIRDQWSNNQYDSSLSKKRAYHATTATTTKTTIKASDEVIRRANATISKAIQQTDIDGIDQFLDCSDDSYLRPVGKFVKQGYILREDRASWESLQVNLLTIVGGIICSRPSKKPVTINVYTEKFFHPNGYVSRVLSPSLFLKYMESVDQMSLSDMVSKGYNFMKQGQYLDAVFWYRKSAERGYPLGQYNLGVMYDEGKGIKQDYQDAVFWYRKAAEQGHREAQNNLGAKYTKGQGVKRDYQSAVEWYRKSAKQGYSIGQFNLGASYDSGQGVKQSHSTAKEWYKKACEGGYKKACLKI